MTPVVVTIDNYTGSENKFTRQEQDMDDITGR